MKKNSLYFVLLAIVAFLVFLAACTAGDVVDIETDDRFAEWSIFDDLYADSWIAYCTSTGKTESAESCVPPSSSSEEWPEPESSSSVGGGGGDDESSSSAGGGGDEESSSSANRSSSAGGSSSSATDSSSSGGSSSSGNSSSGGSSSSVASSSSRSSSSAASSSSVRSSSSVAPSSSSNGGASSSSQQQQGECEVPSNKNISFVDGCLIWENKCYKCNSSRSTQDCSNVWLWNGIPRAQQPVVDPYWYEEITCR